MLMPGFTADAVFGRGGRTSARQSEGGGGGGPIVIEGRCSCIETTDFCFTIPRLCLFGHCTTELEVCIPLCTTIRCTPL